MFETFLLLSTIAAAFFATSGYAAEMSPYLSGRLRYSQIQTEYTEPYFSTDLKDGVVGGSIAVGFSSKTDLGGMRAELEYNYNQDSEDKILGLISTKVKTQSVMLNAYYDVPTGTILTPFVGGGIGYGKIKGQMSYGAFSESMEDDKFVWQVGAGIGAKLTENVIFDVGYRYVDWGSSSQGVVSIDTTSHEAYLGIRYEF